MNGIRSFLGMMVALLSVQCSSDDKSAAGGSTSGAGGSSSAVGGQGGMNTGGSAGATSTGNSGVGGSGGNAGTGGTSAAGGSTSAAYGFSIRALQDRVVTCSQFAAGSPSDPATLSDEDFVCTFVHASTQGNVYVQATPTDCAIMIGATPTAFTALGWLSINAALSPLDGLVYSHGGNHGNNSIEFDYQGSHYRLYHSSIGFGGRCCAPPDCLQVFAADTVTVVEDGCTKDRALPVTCVQVEADGAVPPLEDTFAPCPGDPNFP